MQFRLRSALVVLCVVFATPTLAQSQAERLTQMMSRNYAIQSLQALIQGDSDAALNFALRAFPPEPSDDEIIALPEAMFALEVAAGARIARIDATGEGQYSVDGTGTRAFVGFYDPRPEVNQRYVPPALYDPRDGSLIQVLEPEDRDTWPDDA